MRSFIEKNLIRRRETNSELFYSEASPRVFRLILRFNQIKMVIFSTPRSDKPGCLEEKRLIGWRLHLEMLQKHLERDPVIESEKAQMMNQM